MASTRYTFGDDFTAADYDAVSDWAQNSAGVALATALERRLGTLVRCIPAFDLTTTTPTTIGLGDSFVGGFIAALASER